MKKIFLVLSGMLLLAIGCNANPKSPALENQQVVQQNLSTNPSPEPVAQTPNQIAPTPGKPEDNSPLSFTCKDLITDAQMQTAIGYPATVSDSLITPEDKHAIGCDVIIQKTGLSASGIFGVNHYKDSYKLLFGQTYNDYIARTDKIPGLGYEAIHQEPSGAVRVSMISSNQKYAVDSMIGFKDDKKSNLVGLDIQKSLDANIAALKIIDASLNKY